MSRRYERSRYTRWSDPVLRKHYSLYWTPTSEEEISSVRRSRSSSPLLSVPHRYVPPKKCSSGCCLCHSQSDRRKSSKSHGDHDTKTPNWLNSQEPREMRETLELHLTGTEVEEALAEDRHAILMQHLDLTTTVLEALAQYAQSLQVSQLAACRVFNVSHLLAHPRSTPRNYSNPDSVHLTTHLQQLEIQRENGLIVLRDLIGHCSKHIALPKQLCALMDEKYMRKKDFNIAVKNFKNLLDKSKLSVAQMEKLHRQYDVILNDYQKSRRILDLELPKVVNTRMTALKQAFEKIKEFYSDMDNVNHTLTLFKLVEERLFRDDANTTTIKPAHDQASPNSELCQKCKVNRVDVKK